MVVYGFIPSNPPLSPLYIYRYTPVDNPLYWPPGTRAPLDSLSPVGFLI